MDRFGRSLQFFHVEFDQKVINDVLSFCGSFDLVLLSTRIGKYGHKPKYIWGQGKKTKFPVSSYYHIYGLGDILG